MSGAEKYCLKHNMTYLRNCSECASDMVEQFKDKMVASSTGGLKADFGKPRYDLLSEIALEEIAKVLSHGSKKYAPDNWRNGIEYRRLIRAAIGHILKFSKGEDIDPDTGEDNLLHLAEAGCCIMFLIEMRLIHPELDDRFKSTVTTQFK